MCSRQILSLISACGGLDYVRRICPDSEPYTALPREFRPKERVRNLLIDAEEQLIRAREDTLVKEMARYLYDNGYPVMFHVQTENLQ